MYGFIQSEVQCKFELIITWLSLSIFIISFSHFFQVAMTFFTLTVEISFIVRDLSFNKIKELQEGLLGNLRKLEELYVKTIETRSSYTYFISLS